MGFGKDNKGVIISINISQALGTLGASTGILVGTKPAILERFRMLKTMLHADVKAVTAGEGGLLKLYLADGDLTLAEVEAQIEGTGPVGPNDPVGEALAERPVFFIGAIPNTGSNDATEYTFHDVNSNAPAIAAKPRWTFARTKSWNWVLYNVGAALATGSTVIVTGKVFGVWVT